MTCEVAVMNKHGIALAADSAVTMGNGIKIYHSSEKLFELSPGLPVGIMTYGAAEIMGVPWEPKELRDLMRGELQRSLQSLKTAIKKIRPAF